MTSIGQLTRVHKSLGQYKQYLTADSDRMMILPSLSFPFQPPACGHSLEVVPGVRWIRLALPYRLNHINVWALDDADGWALVDTGVKNEETVSAWEALFTACGSGTDRPLTRVFVTHMHPDHIGMAGWMTRRFKVPLWISQLEYLSCRALVADSGREAPDDALAFLRHAGWSDVAIDAYRTRFGNFGKQIYALPDSFRRLRDEQKLIIGGSTWEVIRGLGHSPEHSCLYSADLKLFISGDQVLPKISSNVSVHPLQPEANPMAEWFESLEDIRQRVPDDVLVLPAHNECFRGLHARIDQLVKGQEAAFDRLLEQMGRPIRVVDTFIALFKRPITEADGTQLGLATGEAIANLNYLRGIGKVERYSENGVHWYAKV